MTDQNLNPVTNTDPKNSTATPATAPSLTPFDAQSYQAVQAIIERLSFRFDEIKQKQKEVKQSLANIFINDDELPILENQAKAASQSFKQKKQQLQETPEAKALSAKLKELNEEVKDIEDALTNHLISYFQMTGTRSFNTPTGEEREFKVLAKLLPKK
jgi:phosphoglycolate phosphatase-like HAD superfamily hydrolase